MKPPGEFYCRHVGSREPSGHLLRRALLLCARVYSFVATEMHAETTLHVGKHFEVRDHDAPVNYVFNGGARHWIVVGQRAHPTTSLARWLESRFPRRHRAELSQATGGIGERHDATRPSPLLLTTDYEGLPGSGWRAFLREPLNAVSEQTSQSQCSASFEILGSKRCIPN